MSKVLVHIHSDLEFKNKVTLAVALAAEKKLVTLFLAADGVNIFFAKVLDKLLVRELEIYTNTWKI